MFPFTFAGCRTFDNAVDDAAERFAREMRRKLYTAHARYVGQTGTELSFGGSRWRTVSALALLGYISSGTIEASMQAGCLHVRYELRFRCMLTSASCAGCVVGIGVATATGSVVVGAVALLAGALGFAALAVKISASNFDGAISHSGQRAAAGKTGAQ